MISQKEMDKIFESKNTAASSQVDDSTFGGQTASPVESQFTSNHTERDIPVVTARRIKSERGIPVMANEVEVFGRVLATFSLVSQGIKIYISSTDNKSNLDEFRKAFEWERIFLYCAWWFLGNSAGVDVGADEVPSPEIMKEVLSFLHPDAVKHFVDACQELDTILGELVKRFNIVGMDYNLDRLHH